MEVLEVRQTEAFATWLTELKDQRARAIIARRVARMAQGNFGDSKSVGDRVSELRIDYGPGYRAYFTKRGREVVVLLCGGDKGSQRPDIAAAKAMAAELHNGS
jgi:putative addiction module killer protein